MTTRVTMLQTRQGDAGASLSSGSSYDVTDALAGQLVGSGAAIYTYALTSFERATAGGYHGERRTFTGLGNVPTVDAVWNATAAVWEPAGGRQPLICDPVTSGTAGLTSAVDMTTLAVPAGLLGLNMGLEIDVAGHSSANTPTARALVLTYGATQILNETTALQRRVGALRVMRNTGTANSQTITNKLDGEYSAQGSANSAGLTAAEDSATRLNLTASLSYTYGTSQTTTVDRYNVWWVK